MEIAEIEARIRETAGWIQPIRGVMVVEQRGRICTCAVGLLAIEAGFLYTHPERSGPYYHGVLEFLWGQGYPVDHLHSLSNGWEGWRITEAEASGTDPLWNLGADLRKELRPELVNPATLGD